MIDLKILKKRGLTDLRLKEIFTAEPADITPADPAKDGDALTHAVGSVPVDLPKEANDWTIRQWWENRIHAHLLEVQARLPGEYRLHAPVNIALDATPITATNFPLMLMGQGYIKFEDAYSQMREANTVLADQLFERNAQGKVIKVNTPKLTEISYNLLHSLTTRRVGAVATPIAQRNPFLKYDSESQSLVGKLRADLMTQRAQRMSDQFGYQHDIVQSVRDVTAHTHQIEFVREAWSVEKQELSVDKPVDATTGVGPESTDAAPKEVIVREGVDFVAPDITRTGWDSSRPVAKLNFDNGPEWACYWDVTRVGSIRRNDAYWNKDEVEITPGAFDWLTNNQYYLSQYYKDTISFPTAAIDSSKPAEANSRTANIGLYAAATDNQSITKAEYFARVIPADCGLGTYKHPVWIRFVIGGPKTVIFAQILPSRPGIYYGYNERDSRQNSPSFCHCAMAIQDQVSNLLSQLLEIQHAGCMRMFALNTHGMAKEDIAKVEDAIKVKNYYQAEAILIKYDGEVDANVGDNANRSAGDRFKSIQVETAEKTGEIFRTIIQLLAFSEKMLFFSPQELGQISPRESTAFEVGVVNSNTNSIHDFHSLGIEEGLDAKKILIYESAVTMGSDEVKLTAQDRYSAKTVLKAGFTIVDEDGDENTNDLRRSGRFTLTGGKEDLIYEYTFTSRDGSERPMSPQLAANQVQYLQVLMQAGIAQKIPAENLYDLLNEIGRNLGIGPDQKLKTPTGQDPTQPIGADDQQKVQAALMQISQAVQALQQQNQQNQSQFSGLAAQITRLARIVETQAGSHEQLRQSIAPIASAISSPPETPSFAGTAPAMGA